MRRAVAVFVVALGLLLPWTPVGATFAGGDGLIYFIDSQSGQPTIVTLNSDGTPGSVGPFPGYVDVEVAPDGRTFLAIDTTGTLWLVSPAGGRRPMSTGGNAVQGAGWAPDGERFLAVSEGEATDLLLIGNVDGRTPSALSVPNIEASPATPVFSVDGSQIFYFSAAADVLPTRLDLATGSTGPIQSQSGAELMPRASSLDVDPSGEQIMYGCTDNAAPRETLCFVRVSDGGFRGALGNTFGPVTQGQFAPDDTGRTVSLLSDQRDGSEVLQVNEFLDGIDIGPGRLPDWGASPTSAPTPLPPTPSETDLTPGGFDGDPTTTERADFSDTVAFAAAVSRARYPSGGFAGATAAPAHVVLSRDDAFADSLAGAALTGNGPLLFTGSTLLPATTRQEIDRLLGGSGTIYLLGGEVAISAGIQQGLVEAGYTVTRLAGPSRVETSVAVAREVLRLFGGSSTIAVARADSPADNPTAAWADSVSGGAWAAADQVPLVVTQTSSVHPAVAALLAEVNPDRTVLLGGTAALGEAVEQGVPNPQRIAGSGRAATAAAVATELIGIPTSGARSLVVFNGVRPDGWRFGLAAAGLAADNDTGLVVVGGDVPVETASLACDAAEVDVLVVGDSSVISEDVLSALDQAPSC